MNMRDDLSNNSDEIKPKSAKTVTKSVNMGTQY